MNEYLERYHNETRLQYNVLLGNKGYLNRNDQLSSNPQTSEIKAELSSSGRWEDYERVLFLKGCILYGNNWKKVKEMVPTRIASQIRSHAQKFVSKLFKQYQVKALPNLKMIKLMKCSTLSKLPRNSDEVLSFLQEHHSVEDLEKIMIKNLEDSRQVGPVLGKKPLVEVKPVTLSKNNLGRFKTIFTVSKAPHTRPQMFESTDMASFKAPFVSFHDNLRKMCNFSYSPAFPRYSSQESTPQVKEESEDIDDVLKRQYDCFRMSGFPSEEPKTGYYPEPVLDERMLSDEKSKFVFDLEAPRGEDLMPYFDPMPFDHSINK